MVLFFPDFKCSGFFAIIVSKGILGSLVYSMNEYKEKKL